MPAHLACLPACPQLFVRLRSLESDRLVLRAENDALMAEMAELKERLETSAEATNKLKMLAQAVERIRYQPRHLTRSAYRGGAPAIT